MKEISLAILLLLMVPTAHAQDQTGLNAQESSEEAGRFLNSLLSAAAAGLREYVEVESSTAPGDSSTPSARDFRLKLYPQGKSRSREHFTAEGSFSLEPGHPRPEFRLRFRAEPDPSHAPASSDGDPV